LAGLPAYRQASTFRLFLMKNQKRALFQFYLPKGMPFRGTLFKNQNREQFQEKGVRFTSRKTIG
jgi:hypothetical protein